MALAKSRATQKSRDYDLFISHKFSNRQVLIAEHIERSIQLIAKPWYKRTNASVFRARPMSNVIPADVLRANLGHSLDRARFLVLLASPEIVNSPWIEYELAKHLDRKDGVQHLIIVLTDGRIVWDLRKNAFDEVRTTSLPKSILRYFNSEPLYLDLTWVRDPKNEMISDHPRYFNEMIKLSSMIKGVTYDEIIASHIGEVRKQKRLVLAVILMIVAMTMLSTIVSFQLLKYRQTIEDLTGKLDRSSEYQRLPR
jgi:hypothetical protein